MENKVEKTTITGFDRLIIKLQEIHNSSTPWNIREQLQTYIHELEAIRESKLKEAAQEQKI